MEALVELCDLIAQNPSLFSEKLSWICTRCPPPSAASHPNTLQTRLTRSHLNAILATARFLSKCSNQPSDKTPSRSPHSAILDFLRSVQSSSFHPSFWPPSFPLDSISSFFSDLFGYVAAAADLSPDFAAAVGTLVTEIIVTTAARHDDDPAGIAKAFLAALSRNCPPIPASDADRLVGCLLDQFVAAGEALVSVPVMSMSSTSASVSGLAVPSSETSSSSSLQVQTNGDSSPVSEVSVTSSPSAVVGALRAKGKEEYRESSTEDDVGSGSAGARSSAGNGSIAGRSSLDQFGGVGDGAAAMRQNVAAFEEELIEGLEKQEIAFRLFAHVLDKVPVKAGHLEQVRMVAAKQLKSLPAFLKIRKRDWTEQGASLKARINTKLSACEAATFVQIKSLLSVDSDAKTSKMLLRGTLALLLDAAEACILSSWRKLRICEELFSSLLNGIAQVAVTRGGQLLRVLLIRLKPLVLTTCAQADTWGNNQGAMFESVTKTSCEIIEFGWSKDRAPVDTFIMGLAASIRERNDYGDQDVKEKQGIPVMQLNVIRLLADLSVSVSKMEVIDMILPLFIESLEEGDASSPSLLRLRLLDAVSRMASLGFEKSYRETVVLMTRSYLDKLSTVGSAESKTLAPEATTERTETLPAGFLLVASGLSSPKLRSDYRHRLLSLCSDVGLAAESKSGRSGADFLGPLLPAVAEICSDFDPTSDVEPSLLKLFRNLWFYVVLFGLAPPIQKNQLQPKSVSTTLNSLGSMSTMALQAVAGPYMWNSQWSMAVQRISQGTPPLVVSSVKWLEDELELNALHNPGSRRGSGNEKAALAQRAALSAALGGRVEVAAMGTISGVKATYLLAVTFLEIIRFSCNGGILNGDSSSIPSRSAFSCVFEYLLTPNLLPAVYQCLTAIVHRAFETAVAWLEERISEIGNQAEIRESILSAHACFFIKSMSQREEHVRDISVSLLTQLKDRFPQVLWNSSCLNTLLFSVINDSPSALVNDPAWIATVRSLYQKIVREWISNALSYAPCTTQGLLQENFCKLNRWQTAQNKTEVVSVLSEIRLSTGKNDCWTGIRTANVPAVIAAAVAASGTSLRVTEVFFLEVLSTGMLSAADKSNCVGEIAGMRRLYESIGGFQAGNSPFGFGLGAGLQSLNAGPSPQQPNLESNSFGEILLMKFVRLLQQFVNTAEKGGVVDKSSFRETCSKATALLLSNLESDSKSNLEGSSQLLRLLCWCPAYISTPEAMETGVFIWTWIVSAAPQLGSLILAELVDAWLWTIDTKRGLFAYEMRHSGPAAKLRPQLTPGEPDAPPEKDPVEGIIAHRLWLGFLIDRFEVVRHDSVEQLLLLSRMLQGTMKSPFHFSHHPAAAGTFFTVMLLGLKFCSCQSQNNLQNCRTGLHLLEDRVYRASLGWFAHEPEWYDNNDKTFAQSEAQSVSVFVHHLMNERVDSSQLDPSVKGRARENGGSVSNVMDQYHPIWGRMENYSVGREKRKQLLLMLCQHESDRLDVWAQPENSKENTSSRPKINSEKWIEYGRTAFSVDPRIALSLSSIFPTISSLRAEVTQLVQLHILDLRTVPEALPFFVTPKAVDENSVLLQQLPHWAACSITQALEFLTPPYKGHPRVMAYVLRVLESYPPERVTFFMPQLVQALRYDEGLVEGYLLGAAQRSNIFAHILIWHLQGESFPTEPGKEAGAIKNASFQELLPILRQRIIDSFTPEARDMFQREFNFFDKVTSISGVLFPLPKEQRRAGIRRELEKIEMEGDDLYLPTATNKLVRGIRVDSGIALQSAAKVPIMITFDVVDRDGNHNDVKPQACIFKVGDDCRQDVLALQVISLLRDIFEAVGLNLYVFPYGVLPTGPERGIIEVVPNTRSRSQMGETTDGGLYEIFQQDFGPVGSPSFEAARDNFIISSAGYAVASLLLQPKDRHNGNLLFDNVGRLVHIDFGFILETSPGGNMRFESAQFKLSHEMTQLLDPSGVMKSDTWFQFVSLCVKGYLAARRYMDGIISTVLLMVDSGLPCFSRGDPIGNLRKRFHPEMSEREAAIFMMRTCTDAYNKWTTAGYDLIQYLQQGIEK
ncbi:phosphatidylinositol 4-kinase alpha 1 isoform X2 [Magnolia sinica]|uniref:phosphatidylinositol 4-kinase alpha 1 isoform X2 n=1 Tax=Magnolia sinica TaxID=86752 RepID=UPI002657C8FA|nr:phosphatidylinositol 4-kinase alpha 1 isoform X2 [Magnolia sinica]